MKRIIGAIALILTAAMLFCACGQSAAKPLSEIFGSIKAEYSVTDMVEFDDVSTLERFYGITEDQVDEFAGGVNNSGVKMEEIVLVKAKDSAAASDIAEKLNNRLSSKLNETKNYNPEQYAIVEKSSVDTDNLYVSLIISENVEGMKKLYKEGIGAAE